MTIAPQEATPALKIVGEVQSLHIKSPNDVVIIKVPFPVSKQELENLTEMCKQTTGIPNRVISVAEGVDINVIRPPIKEG